MTENGKEKYFGLWGEMFWYVFTGEWNIVLMPAGKVPLPPFFAAKLTKMAVLNYVNRLSAAAQDILQKKSPCQRGGQNDGGGVEAVADIVAQNQTGNGAGIAPDRQDQSGNQQKGGQKNALSNYVICPQV